MTLEERIHQDYTVHLKARNQQAVAALRLLLTNMKNERIARGSDLSDDDVVRLVQREGKRRKESIDAFGKAGRTAQVAEEEAGLRVLYAYLPAQLSEEELLREIRMVLRELPSAGPGDFGKAMPKVMQRVQGKADGKTVQMLVQRELRAAT